MALAIAVLMAGTASAGWVNGATAVALRWGGRHQPTFATTVRAACRTTPASRRGARCTVTFTGTGRVCRGTIGIWGARYAIRRYDSTC